MSRNPARTMAADGARKRGERSPQAPDSGGPVLLSWLAPRTDPFERLASGGEYRETPRGRVPGPTLNLLFDPGSAYEGRIADVVIFRQGGKQRTMHDRVYEQLVEALCERAPATRLHPYVWGHDEPDPTDHSAIFSYLRATLPEVRRRFAGRELVVQLSAGTAAMHTVWALMATAGFIGPPFTAVQTFRPEERKGRSTVVPLDIGLETFFKRWQETSLPVDDGDAVRWDPGQFRSPRLRALYDEARRVAGLRVPVLVLGERGTGKTTLAAWIRLQSPFRRPELDRSWFAVPCGQFIGDTFRAELFGYKKGAFTGANKDEPGIFDLADGDTVFLDEIGDIGRDVQRLLIKVIEEGTFHPVGSKQVRRVEVRLLTATNVGAVSLHEKLDADFLDRVRAFTLTVPALREIPEEIEWLWPSALEVAARRAGAPARYARMEDAPRDEVVRQLRAHPLPGNVRDLVRVAYRFLAARCDDAAPMTVRDAVAYALEALGEWPPAGAAEPAASLARGFADGAAIDPALLQVGRLDPWRTIEEFKHWFGDRVADLAQTTGRRESTLTTITDRALRKWRQSARRGRSP